MPVHVSIHDVSPAWSAEVERALALCAEVAATPALLVVPDHHGTAPLLDDALFCARLRELQARGHEVYLHGLRHRAAPLPGGPLSLRRRAAWIFAQKVVSAGEAELAHLGPTAGRALVDEGARVLGDAGLRLDGYVAPAWTMPGWLLPALAERGIRYTESHTRIFDPVAGLTRPSVVLNWATRSRMRLVSSAAWCRAARPARRFVPARIAIHPADMRDAFVVGEVRSALAWARSDLVASGRRLLGQGPPSVQDSPQPLEGRTRSGERVAGAPARRGARP
jgi:predicted deacetylase